MTKQKDALIPLLPVALSQEGKQWFDLQMWCLGQDVLSQQGNLLVAYGFEKVPSPTPKHRSFYRRSSVQLWSWRAWVQVCQQTSLFISRQSFEPLMTDHASQPAIWSLSDLPPLKPPAPGHGVRLALEGLIDLCQEMSHYEQFVTQNTPSTYREQVILCYPPYRHIKSHLKGTLAFHWQRLSEALSAVYQQTLSFTQ